MNRRILLLLIFGFCGQSIYTQNVPARHLDGNQLIISANSDTEGSPYFYDELLHGELITIYGDTIENILLNYDGVRQRFVAKSNNEDELLIELNFFLYERVRIPDRGHEFVNAGKMGDPSYFRVIYEGENVSCYEKFSSERRTTNSNSAIYGKVQARYRMDNDVDLFLFINEELVPAKRKEKDLDKLLECNDLKRYSKQYKLKLSRDEDLVKLFQYCDN